MPETPSSEAMHHMTLSLKDADKSREAPAGSGVQAVFLRGKDKAHPGNNSVEINGFPGSVDAISAWVSEQQDFGPNYGALAIYTSSVEASKKTPGTVSCRVIFSSNATGLFDFVVCLIYGPV
jgi:hypothetical protein